MFTAISNLLDQSYLGDSCKWVGFSEEALLNQFLVLVSCVDLMNRGQLLTAPCPIHVCGGDALCVYITKF